MDIVRGGMAAILLALLAGGCAQQTRPVAAAAADPSFRPDVPTVYYAGDADSIYISLAAGDHIQAGERLICQDSRGARSALEVMEVGPSFSRCRLVAGAPVQAGNTILLDNRPRQFAVIGEFDLHNRGYATVADRLRVDHLIAQRGGVPVDHVSATTDVLVAGARPADPAMPGDVSRGSVIDHRLADQRQYDQQVGKAEEFAVPVLNSNRLQPPLPQVAVDAR